MHQRDQARSSTIRSPRHPRQDDDAHDERNSPSSSNSPIHTHRQPRNRSTPMLQTEKKQPKKQSYDRMLGLTVAQQALLPRTSPND